jgi:hypothetical protein
MDLVYGLDVSKGESQIQAAFLVKGKPYRKNWLLSGTRFDDRLAVFTFHESAKFDRIHLNQTFD